MFNENDRLNGNRSLMLQQSILVTGSRGLIGTLLCTSLESAGHNVVRFDTRERIESESYGNVLDLQCISQKMENCHGVIHLAAVSRVIWGEQNPRLCRLVN